MLPHTTVSDVMTSGVYAFAQDTSIETAARVLNDRHITGAPVVTHQGRPVGVVSIADLLDPDCPITQHEGYPLFYRITDNTLEELCQDLSTSAGQVGDVMSPFVLSIESTATIAEAASRMIGEDVHRLLVMNAGSLIGIVTSTDLLRGFAMQMKA